MSKECIHFFGSLCILESVEICMLYIVWYSEPEYSSLYSD